MPALVQSMLIKEHLHVRIIVSMRLLTSNLRLPYLYPPCTPGLRHSPFPYLSVPPTPLCVALTLLTGFHMHALLFDIYGTGYILVDYVDLHTSIKPR